MSRNSQETRQTKINYNSSNCAFMVSGNPTKCSGPAAILLHMSFQLSGCQKSCLFQINQKHVLVVTT